MRYAVGSFDNETGEMEPALYCVDCARWIVAEGFHWKTVLLSDDDDFCCDHCYTREAPSTAINGSAWLQDELEPQLNHAR